METQTKLFHFSALAGGGGSELEAFETIGRQEFLIRPGIWLSRVNFSPERAVHFNYEKRIPVVDFGFAVSGNFKKQSGAGVGANQIQVTGGLSGIRYDKGHSGVFQLQSHNTLQLIHIHMTLEVFRSIIGRDTPLLPPNLQKLLKGSVRTYASRLQPMSPEIQSLVYQMLNASNNALPWQLYLEGKTLELISLSLAGLSLAHRASERGVLTPREKKRVTEARALLVADIHSPPTLAHLAGAAGLNENKLQAGFQEIYGKTVFDYFREHRMQIARRLLEKAETNVSETAWQIGYVNVSHFSAAFKKRFGVLPKQYLKHAMGKQAWA